MGTPTSVCPPVFLLKTHKKNESVAHLQKNRIKKTESKKQNQKNALKLFLQSRRPLLVMHSYRPLLAMWFRRALLAMWPVTPHFLEGGGGVCPRGGVMRLLDFVFTTIIFCSVFHFNLNEIRFSFKFKTMSRAFYVDVVMYPCHSRSVSAVLGIFAMVWK